MYAVMSNRVKIHPDGNGCTGLANDLTSDTLVDIELVETPMPTTPENADLTPGGGDDC